MAFGIGKHELITWKKLVNENHIAFLTHYWTDPRYPNCNSVTKVGCKDLGKLAAWGQKYRLQKQWIDRRNTYPHFDLLGDKQKEVLIGEGQSKQLKRFRIE